MFNHDSTRKLYRFFDKRGRLIYVGISMRPINRILSHHYSGRWFARVYRYTLSEAGRNLSEARAHERSAIFNESPLLNITHQYWSGRNHPQRNEKLSYIKKLLDADSRKRKMVILYNKGKTMEEIAKEFGISKQRVHAVIKEARQRKSSDLERVLNRSKFK